MSDGLTTEEKRIVSDMLKKLLHMEYLTKRAIDSYSAIFYLLKDIWRNSRSKKAPIFSLGYETPKSIPFYPGGNGKFDKSYLGPTSGTQYNDDLIVNGDQMVEYDIRQAYTSVMRSYALPSNKLFDGVKMTTEKLEKRFADYESKRHPYRDLKTLAFIDCKIAARAKPDTYLGRGAMLQTNYGNSLMSSNLIVSEIELKAIFDFYDVMSFSVNDSFVFQTKKGLLQDYFDRIEVIRVYAEAAGDQLLLDAYKDMRNKVYGAVGRVELLENSGSVFKFPMYNRAFSSMVSGVVRDTMLRYEQKYVNSEYGLIMIKTDGIYFKNEVPEFNRAVELGAFRRHDHLIDKKADMWKKQTIL